MKAILFGATGMVGQGVLRECLADPGVESVLSIARNASGRKDPKLREIVIKDVANLGPVEDQLIGYDACFFTLGVSSAGMSEAAYRPVTYDLTLKVACTLLKINPGITFIYVSGLGTDSSESGRTMWARVKGQTENALLRMPFKAAYMFRPGFIQPLHGIQSRTALYRVPYIILSPVIPLLRKFFPKYVTTTEVLGRAMIKAARSGAPKTVLESQDINAF
jgi:uncharacterized protein YbjT (DUF2867 family)